VLSVAATSDAKSNIVWSWNIATTSLERDQRIASFCSEMIVLCKAWVSLNEDERAAREFVGNGESLIP